MNAVFSSPFQKKKDLFLFLDLPSRQSFMFSFLRFQEKAGRKRCDLKLRIVVVVVVTVVAVVVEAKNDVKCRG